LESDCCSASLIKVREDEHRVKINARSSRRKFQQFQATSFEDSFSGSGLFAANDSTEISGWAPVIEIIFQKNDNCSDVERAGEMNRTAITRRQGITIRNQRSERSNGSTSVSLLHAIVRRKTDVLQAFLKITF
jgi:hypothetical protein